jgi:chemotaxis protein histidine kinase CheA
VADCVDALNGDIRVESTLGEGTTFFLELPPSVAEA